MGVRWIMHHGWGRVKLVPATNLLSGMNFGSMSSIHICKFNGEVYLNRESVVLGCSLLKDEIVLK